MNTDLIFPMIAGAAFAVVLAVWKTGRAVAAAALRHPLRQNVIYVDASGATHVVEMPSSNGFKPQAARATQGVAAEQTQDRESKPYTVVSR